MHPAEDDGSNLTPDPELENTMAKAVIRKKWRCRLRGTNREPRCTKPTPGRPPHALASDKEGCETHSLRQADRTCKNPIKPGTSRAAGNDCVAPRWSTKWTTRGGASCHH